jgi:glycine C-acetyltransferase/8-amino-7-oxononanoate synthase
VNEETIVFEGAGDVAALLACGALRGSVAGFAQPRGPDLMRRIEPLDDWCALRAAYGVGVWQNARALDGAAFSTATRGVNFASSDYLSLAAHPAVREAAAGALQDAGPHSAGAASLLGNGRLSLALEAALGALLLLEHVTLFPSGWGAAFGAITALVHGRDYVVIDAQAATRCARAPVRPPATSCRTATSTPAMCAKSWRPSARATSTTASWS